MSDPMNRPNDRVVESPPPPAPPESQPRKSASPLIWILLLLALLALGWYAYNSLGFDRTVPDVAPPATEATTGIDNPGDAEASADDAATGKPDTAAKRTVAKRKPAGTNRKARLIDRSAPEYPREALRAGAEGTVVVLAQIDANGVPTQVEVVDRSGSRELDRSALDAVRKWRFSPAMKDGQRVASTVQVPVEFRRERQ